MKRREFIALLGGAAAAYPLAARAQQALPVIGYLDNVRPAPTWVEAFHAGLGSSGIVDGQNATVEFQLAGGRSDRLAALAADLVRRQVAVIVTSGGPAPALAAKSATSSIPIVFVSGSDPLKFGIVTSLNRPGGNITGVVFFNATLGAKRLELLRELVPGATVIAYIVNADNPESEPEQKDVQDAARALGIELHVLRASSEREIDESFASLASLRVKAVVMASDPYLGSRRAQVAALADRHAMPVIGTARESVVLGGLASYGTSILDAYRQAGSYAGRVLKGEKPADLPVMQPTKFELVINLKTAKTLGLEVPHKVLALADEVIE